MTLGSRSVPLLRNSKIATWKNSENQSCKVNTGGQQLLSVSVLLEQNRYVLCLQFVLLRFGTGFFQSALFFWFSPCYEIKWPCCLWCDWVPDKDSLCLAPAMCSFPFGKQSAELGRCKSRDFKFFVCLFLNRYQLREQMDLQWNTVGTDTLWTQVLKEDIVKIAPSSFVISRLIWKILSVRLT